MDGVQYRRYPLTPQFSNREEERVHRRKQEGFPAYSRLPKAAVLARYP
uniref:Neurofilament heavy polypeptide n=1 Tax=Rhizophora mucronata TaxID=61149 RepID=A0A2P2KMB1_RHIMU